MKAPPAPPRVQRLRAAVERRGALLALLLLMTIAELYRQHARAVSSSSLTDALQPASGASVSTPHSLSARRAAGAAAGAAGGAYAKQLRPLLRHLQRQPDATLQPLLAQLLAAAPVDASEARQLYARALARLQW